MGVCNTWNVKINILIYENETISLPAGLILINLEILNSVGQSSVLITMLIIPYIMICTFTRK